MTTRQCLRCGTPISRYAAEEACYCARHEAAAAELEPDSELEQARRRHDAALELARHRWHRTPIAPGTAAILARHGP